MTARSSTADGELSQLCQDLRLLWEQAGGPSVRRLADRVGLGKTQVGAILSGGIRRPPDWDVMRGLVEAFYKYAHDHGREQELTIRAGVDEYWRPRHAVVEHAFSHGPRAQREHPPTAIGEPAAAAITLPQQLPPIAPHFAGRQAELSVLTASPAGPLLITGMAGVGKTTLAVAWAHQMASRFPDGQLYLNLRGFDPSGQTISPDQAVRVLLETLLPAPHHLPPGFEAQTGLYRSLLANKRMLVLLDNARDADQVRALLPGAPGCRALVTSRVDLAGLVASDGAFPLVLSVLPDIEARELLANRLGRQRVSAEPEAVRRLIAICGGLPIALAIVAARAAGRPDFSLSALADETDRARGGLSAFRLGDPSADARAVFSWSYQALSVPAARLFRLFGVVSFPDIGVHAAASLAGLPLEQTVALLEELCRAHLVAEAAPARYVLHDLMRAFATEMAQDEDDPATRELALLRYLDHHAYTAYAATMVLSPRRAPIGFDPAHDGVTPQPLSERADATRWFIAESEAVLIAAAQAAELGHDSHVWRLAWAVADFFEILGHFHDWVALQELAIAAARRSADRETYGRMLVIGGNACIHADDLDRALWHLEASHEVFERIGNLEWLARAVNDTGQVLERQGRYAEALKYAQRSLEIYCATGNLTGQARARNSCGWCHCMLGQHERAIEECGLAMAHYQIISDVSGEASVWDSLGHAHHGLRRHAVAIECYREALRCVRFVGDRYNEAGILVGLGDAQLDAGDEAEAQQSWRLSLAIYDELSEPEAGQVRQRLGSDRGSAGRS